MLNPTEIEWCDRTWNPITGCLHGCTYCYARKQARRFTGNVERNLKSDQLRHIGGGLYELDAPFVDEDGNRPSFPAGFAPTLHKYRLGDPAKTKRSYNVFVGSMADVFGEWVPDEWIKAVFGATNQAPQHNYIYLTKNPDRYYQLGEGDDAIIPDDGVTGWFGASAATEEQAWAAWQNTNCRWMSLEPLHGEFGEEFFWHDALVGDGVFDTVRRWEWIVVGAETGNRKGKVAPERVWIKNILANCRETGTPVFMKDSLADIWGEPLIREYPPQLQPRPAPRPKRRIPVKCVLDPVCCDECETPLQGKPAVRLGVKRYECMTCYEKLEAAL